jgi:hypothetical protein
LKTNFTASHDINRAGVAELAGHVVSADGTAFFDSALVRIILFLSWAEFTTKKIYKLYRRGTYLLKSTAIFSVMLSLEMNATKSNGLKVLAPSRSAGMDLIFFNRVLGSASGF